MGFALGHTVWWERQGFVCFEGPRAKWHSRQSTTAGSQAGAAACNFCVHLRALILFCIDLQVKKNTSFKNHSQTEKTTALPMENFLIVLVF